MIELLGVVALLVGMFAVIELLWRWTGGGPRW